MSSSYRPIAPSVADIKTQIEAVVTDAEARVKKAKAVSSAHEVKRDAATTALAKDVAKAKNDAEIKSHLDNHVQFLEAHAAAAAGPAHELEVAKRDLAAAKAELQTIPDIDLT